ncbi:LptA/OstA family protein [Paracidobacterium acidisoli]|uniref:Organic solvent tolerance-like N-terminal domain-containing protein n=1 Tax=Paracidobacterium acidisoli TaxID=2303751 RepID=A0A372ISE5_9BACT|nr:LptA/OstA family protein [Paracidobacterium acidisoli]MBT9330790.1 LptA/OstA family protein [Paracidobacterium acidisoli]
MRITIAGLRRWIVALACLLIAVLLGFFLWSRYRFRHIDKDLPARLGIDVQQTANEFTYSQSSQGHTLYTIHASKLIQYKAGHAQLHNVVITLYGPPGSGRQDRISGESFAYDQNAGLVSADGEVNIDLSGPVAAPAGASVAGTASGSAATAAQAGNTATAAGTSSAQTGGSSVAAEEAQPGGSTIHIRTTGLIFSQKTGDASTAQAVEFQFPRAAGSSVGASYNSKDGILVLDNQVNLVSSSNGHSTVVHASHATLLRQTEQALLVDATSEYESEQSSADQAVVWFRHDGSARQIDSQGHVRLVTDSGDTVTSQTAHVVLNEKSQPLSAELAGGVTFDSGSGDAKRNASGNIDRMHGVAREGTLTFGANSLLQHAQMREAVDFTDSQFTVKDRTKPAATRRLQAAKVDIAFAPAPGGRKSLAQTALATGEPVATLLQASAKGAPQTTTIRGDSLLATLADGNTLRLLDGTGHTRIVSEASDGSVNTSTGDTLHVTFVPAAPRSAMAQHPAVAQHSAARVDGGADLAEAKRDEGNSRGNHASGGRHAAPAQIETAVQDGHVVMTQTPAKKPGAAAAPATLTAWADHAEYLESSQVLHLTGSPRIYDGQSLQLAARTIDYHRDSGDMAAKGEIRATYVQPPQNGSSDSHASGSGRTGAAESAAANGAGNGFAAPSVFGGGSSAPVHVLADRADLRRSSGTGFFYGTALAPARMWQQDNSVWAPVIELHRADGVLKAYGQDTGPAAVVNTNFTSEMGAKHQPSVIRIHSVTLVYSDKARQGDFDGSVVADDADGTVRADHAVVYLKPAPKPSAGKTEHAAVDHAASDHAAGGMAGRESQVDRMIATGHVLLTQTGRKGEGTRLVYTAADGRYVLTGGPQALPYLVDQVHGKTTGNALIFNSQDDSVEVSGGSFGAVTDTRTPKK